MGIAEWFKPKWKSPDVQKRMEAVSGLDTVKHRERLIQLASSDKAASVRQAALEKLDLKKDHETVAAIAFTDESPMVRQSAVNLLDPKENNAILLKIIEEDQDNDIRQSVFEKIAANTSQAAIANIALSNSNDQIRLQALALLEPKQHQDTFSVMFKNDQAAEIRLAAMAQIEPDRLKVMALDILEHDSNLDILDHMICFVDPEAHKDRLLEIANRFYEQKKLDHAALFFRQLVNNDDLETVFRLGGVYADQYFQASLENHLNWKSYFKRAEETLLKAAESGHVMAATILGSLYLNSMVHYKCMDGDLELTPEKAADGTLKWLKLGEEQMQPKAFYNLATFYGMVNFEHFNLKNRKDQQKAYFYYLLTKLIQPEMDTLDNNLSCTAKLLSSDEQIGVMEQMRTYLRPLVEKNWASLVDTGLIIEQLEAHARTGDPSSQYQLACRYYHGVGAEQDFQKAAEWFQSSADQNYPPAQYRLGNMAFNHKIPKNISPEMAFQLCLTAAQSGLVEAMVDVGAMYANGLGIQRSLDEAAFWFTMALVGNIPYWLTAYYLGSVLKGRSDAEATRNMERVKQLKTKMPPLFSITNKDRAGQSSAQPPEDSTKPKKMSEIAYIELILSDPFKEYCHEIDITYFGSLFGGLLKPLESADFIGNRPVDQFLFDHLSGKCSQCGKEITGKQISQIAMGQALRGRVTIPDELTAFINGKCSSCSSTTFLINWKAAR